MKLTEVELAEIRGKYRHLTNYVAGSVSTPIDPINYVDSNGDTLLHIAAQGGDAHVVELLLSAGMPVDTRGDMQNTALHYASDRQTIEVLLEHGACKEALNEFGEKALVIPP